MRAGSIWFTRMRGNRLVKEYIPNTMMGLEYLWGGPVKLETTEMFYEKGEDGVQLVKSRVRYTMENRKISRTLLQTGKEPA